MSPVRGTHPLHQLARLYGVQRAYYDVNHHRQVAQPETLLAALRQLGAPVATIRDVPLALRERRQSMWRSPLEPVVLAWEGTAPEAELRLPARVADVTLRGHLALEGGEQRDLGWQGAHLPGTRSEEVEGTRYLAKTLPLPRELPLGYHRLTLELPVGPAETLIIVAPRKAYAPSGEKGTPMWGVFLPLYSLRTNGSWGCGDFSGLRALMRWMASLGGGLVATLPFLAAFLDEPLEPSPYAPASRLLWNELYVDVTKASELGRCPQAQSLLTSAPFGGEVAALNNTAMVHYRRLAALKRSALEALARCCFEGGGEGLEHLRRFVQANPVVDDYARFRATQARHGASWRSWPQPMRGGLIGEGDYDEGVRRYHLYAQWLAHQQVQSLGCRTLGGDVGLCLDMPLGVHPDGYDVWREQETFALDASVGAPPDAFCTKGQDWGFPPLHPDKLREQGYRYYIACLRHQLRHAALLRIDHVMGFHRLFWISRGVEARQGVYVRYRAEELYAIVALESHRSKAMIVGEDPGTVPPWVRPAMARHGLQGMYVVQYELAPGGRDMLARVPRDTVACLNTHDMPTFGAFLQGLDIQDRQELGLLSSSAAQRERRQRQALGRALVRSLQQKGWIQGPVTGPGDILRGVLAFLARSPAQVVLVNLEDLWLETQPQNVPGTSEERPNWCRKARFALEEFSQMPQEVDTLLQVARLRDERKGQ